MLRVDGPIEGMPLRPNPSGLRSSLESIMEEMGMEKIRYSDLLPGEFRERLAAKPGAYLPLGTLAWHGEHLPLGSDAIQSEVLQGMDYADSTDPHRQLDGSCFSASSILERAAPACQPSRQRVTDTAVHTAAVTGDERHSIF